MAESKAGTLGNGSFSYDCISPQDPYCPNARSLNLQPFPSGIAVGGRFTLTYTPSDAKAYPNVTVQSVSADFFVSQGSVFGAVRVGSPWFAAFTQDGRVLDITPVTVDPITSVRVAEVASGPRVDLAGTTHTFGATALGTLGQPLAGEVLYSWTSSNPSVLAVQNATGQPSPSSHVDIAYVSGGTATITATSSTSQGFITVNVRKLGL